MTEPLLVFVYRNRPDDKRTRSVLHFCGSCGGWYGVPHDGSHCQRGAFDQNAPAFCACRFCREATGQPIQGKHGFFTRSQRWQP